MSARERKQLLQAAESCFRSGQAGMARQVLERLVAMDASSARAFELLGYVHGNEGRLQEALRCLERACQLPGASPEAHYYLGVALLRQGEPDRAIVAFDQSMAVAGPFFEALHERGTACSRLGRHAQALKSYVEAARFRADSFELVFNLAKTHEALKNFGEALSHYDRAIALRPDSADAWAHKGALLYDAQRHADAAACWERALALEPGIEHLRGFLLHARLRTCAWRDWLAQREDLLVRLARGEDVCGPFEMLSISDDAASQHAAARAWTRSGTTLDAVPPLELPPPARRLRVGYFSADFGRHAVSHLIVELCERHDRERFETYAFAMNPADPQDEMRARLERAFDHFIDVSALPDAEIVRRARGAGLDIAIDLGGHTRGARTAVLRARVAPVQVNYLGYPGTMGSESIDYLIADETTIPAASRAHYAERIVWLPDCFQPSDTRRTLAQASQARSAWGLPESGFVFCCFNNSYKINPETFESWMRILGQVDGACLWLLADSQAVERNLREYAWRHGVDPGRLVFGHRLPMSDYLARYQQADLFLDTMPFNAGTTASDALFAGLPVLTRPGEAFASRMAASLLRAIDLPELVAPSAQAYEATAVRLARNRDELRLLRERLQRNRQSAPLFDMAAYTRHLEAAFDEMTRRSRLGLPPDHLHIPREAAGASAT